MRSLLLAAALVAIPSSAFAMGVYDNIQVVAWNGDGSTALLTSDAYSSGTRGHAHTYIVVSAGDSAAVVVSFDDTQNPDSENYVEKQNVDAATCHANAKQLTDELAKRHVTGVKVQADHCDSDRAVVSISKSVTAKVAASQIKGLDTRKPSGAREKRVANAVTHALTAIPDSEIWSATGKLIVVMSGAQDDNGYRRTVAVVEDAAGGAKVLIDNLR